MGFGLFKKYCAVCGKEVLKKEAIVRFGEHLCSSEHAEEYRKKVTKERSKTAGGGGCCG